MPLSIGDLILFGRNFEAPILAMVEDSWVDFLGDTHYKIFWLDSTNYGNLNAYDAESYRINYLTWRYKNGI